MDFPRRLQLCIIDPPVFDDVLLVLSFAGASGSIRNTTTTSSLCISMRLTSALMISRLVLKSTMSSVTSIFFENSSSRSITKNSSYFHHQVIRPPPRVPEQRQSRRYAPCLAHHKNPRSFERGSYKLAPKNWFFTQSP